jgi:cob(I)alamin adenosyltransferase
MWCILMQHTYRFVQVLLLLLLGVWSCAVALSALRDLQGQLVTAQADVNKRSQQMDDERSVHKSQLEDMKCTVKQYKDEVDQLRQLVVELKDNLAQCLDVRLVDCCRFLGELTEPRRRTV